MIPDHLVEVLPRNDDHRLSAALVTVVFCSEFCWCRLGWLCQILQAQSLFGEILRSPTMVNPFSFPELTREILEKIKMATGQPIDTKRFMPIPSSKGVVNYQPFSKKSKRLKLSNNNKQNDGFFVNKDGKKSMKNDKARYNEVSKKSKKGKESEKQEFGDFFGEEHQFLEERFFKKNHQEEGDGHGEEKSKSGRNQGKYFVKKGYRDIFHRDEARKYDSFWDKFHEEGKWFHYGLRNRKKEEKKELGEEEEKAEHQKESSEYEKKTQNRIKNKRKK